MIVDHLLAHLDKVRKTSKDSWIACCPHHDDKSPSMTIREVDDGRLLLHCFAGCSVEDVLGSMGMTFSDLYPEKPLEHSKPMRRPFPAGDVLEMVANEALIVAVASSNIRQGIQLTDVDHDRLWTAQERLEEARRIALGGR